MKKGISLLAVLCSLLLLIALLPGCSNNGASETDPPAPPVNNDDPKQPDDPVKEEYVFKMPISDEPYTITAWRSYSSQYLQSPNEILCNAELEKRTNIHVDYKLAAANAQEQYNLFIMSGDLTDIIYQGVNKWIPTFTGGIDKAIEDGIFLELSEVVDKWMPNFKTLMDENPDIKKQVHTDAGNIGVIMMIQNGNQPAPMGPMFRIDYLEAVGITDAPETYDDWYVALSKFKNDLNLEMPLSIRYLGYNDHSKSLTSGFGIDTGFYNENGTVKFGFIEEGFREYLTLMNKWYSEKLIDQDFFTRVSDFPINTDNLVSGKIGAADFIFYTMPGVYKMMSDNPDFHLKAVPIPRKTANEVAHFRRFNHICGDQGTVITQAVSDSDKLEIIARWLDYSFTDEGATLLNYGIENDTFIYVDGKPQYTEKVYKNPDGISFADMRNQVAEQSGGMFYDWTREEVAFTEEELEAYDIWCDSASGDWVMPPVSLTSDEGAEHTQLYSDIQTLIDETIPQFILGTKSLSEFDSFVEQIKTMGIDTCIELHQNALDRYLKR